MPTRAMPEDGRQAAGRSRLRRRKEFLRVAGSGLSRSSPSFKLQMAPRSDRASDPPRFGFTVTKKTAGAVGRNRIRRRLKEALRLGGALAAQEGCDYVFVARRAALTAPFDDLIKQMAEGLTRIGRQGVAKSSPNRRNRPPAP
jgi:ribonuclease P protein component